jgi:transcription elongation factor Elf1
MGELLKLNTDRVLTCQDCDSQQWHICLDQTGEVKMFICPVCGAEIEFYEDCEQTGIMFELP